MAKMVTVLWWYYLWQNWGVPDNLESDYRGQFQDSQAPRPVLRPRQQFSRAGALSFSLGHHLHLLCCHSHYYLPYHHNLHCHLDNQSSHFLVTNSRTQARSGDISRGETGTSASKEDQVRTQFEYCCSMDRLLHWWHMIHIWRLKSVPDFIPANPYPLPQ